MADDTRIAYFSMEIGLEPTIPTYSGGLGILAGDTIRAAVEHDTLGGFSSAEQGGIAPRPGEDLLRLLAAAGAMAANDLLWWLEEPMPFPAGGCRREKSAA